MCLKVSDPPLDMFCFLCCLFSRRFLDNQKNLRENQQYQRKQKQPSGKHKNNEVFKGFRPTLGYVSFLFVWLSRLFLLFWCSQTFVCLFCKTFGKTKKQKKNKKTYPRVGLKPLNTLFFGFPEGVLVFFGFLWYLWFSWRFFWFSKNLRENNTNTTNKPISKGGSETFKHFVVVGFPEGVFGFYLVFFCIFGFLKSCFGFVKTFGKTKKQYPRVGLKPLNTLFFGFSRRCFWFLFGFLWYCWFSLSFFGFVKTFGKTKKHIQGWVWNL